MLKYRYLWPVQCVLLMLISCQSARDINRVEANAVQKSIFDGEWYHRALVVDTQHQQDTLFTGLECDLDRVRFEITEKMLIAYRSYEKAPQSAAGVSNKQTMIAAFPIVKHFDIRRKYNPLNGVEKNEIEENDYDRKWFEREHMRVDWSTNLVPDLQCNDWIQSIGALQIARDADSQPQNPWKVRTTNNYIETTIDLIAQPQKRVCDHVGDWNCQGSNIKMKFSFMKIDPNRDYEKKSYPDSVAVEVGQNEAGDLCVKGDEGCQNTKPLRVHSNQFGTELCDPSRHGDDCSDMRIPIFEQFGFFRTERVSYDREEGFNYKNREQLVNRWNIWQRSKDVDGKPIPMSARIPKPIVYYLNVHFPDELMGTMQALADEWSVAFTDTVAQLKANCTLQGVNRYVDDHQLHNAMRSAGFGVVTEENLKPACATLGQIAVDNKIESPFFGGAPDQIEKLYGKLFQIRKNDCNIDAVTAYAREHDLSALLEERGITNISRGNLEEACAVLEWASGKRGIEPAFSWQQIGDLRYSFVNWVSKAEMASPLGYGPSATDPLTGEIISANANIYGAEIETYAAWAADVVQHFNQDASDVDIATASNFDNGSQDSSAAISKLFEQRFGQAPEQLVKIPDTSIGENLSILRANGFEDQFLATADMAALFEKAPVMTKPSIWARPYVPTADHDSGRFDLSKDGLAADYEKKLHFFGSRNACFFGDSIEPGVAELAMKMAKKPWQEVYTKTLQSIFYGVTAHEMGHTFGERHNFEGSADPLNYFPNFWGVDTHDHRTTKLTDQKSQMRYSSIMDYMQEFSDDFAGLGLYDKAAIKFAYGDLVEVFDESESTFVPKDWNEVFNLFHYKDLPYLLSGNGANEVLNAHYDAVLSDYDSHPDTARINVASLHLTAKPENLFKRRYVTFNDFYRQYALQKFGMTQGNGVSAVPYRYCSDAYAWGGNMTCNRWDKGGSAEEIVENAAKMYESYYLFNGFRRDRIHFSPYRYISRMYNQVYRPMINPYRSVYLYRNSSSRIWPRIQDLTVAAYKGINFLGRVLQTVEPGRYCLTDENQYIPESQTDNCDQPIEIGLGQGRFYDTKWTSEFFSKPEVMGNMYDKLLAMEVLTDGVGYVSRDMSELLTRGAYSIGYYRLFAPEMIKLFSGMIRGDLRDLSPSIVMENGHPKIQYKQLVSASASVLHDPAPKIVPTQSLTLRYYATVFSMLNLSSTVDKQLDFGKRARITRVGSAQDPAVEGVDSIIFVDPITKIKYRALAPESQDLSVGYQLLMDAQDFVNDGRNGRPQGPWHRALSELQDAESAAKQARLARADDDTMARHEDRLTVAKENLHGMNIELHDRVQMIDMVRYLGDMLDHGN